MLKQDQLVLLPCHEAIGKVVFVNEEKAVIRVENENDAYDVIVTPEGLLPHTQVFLVEDLKFKPNENIIVKPVSNGNMILLATIQEFKIIKASNDTIELRVCVKDVDGEIYNYPLDKCEKLFKHKKIVDKLFRQNDKFTFMSNQN